MSRAGYNSVRDKMREGGTILARVEKILDVVEEERMELEQEHFEGDISVVGLQTAPWEDY